jgi:hypothetical protein
MLPSNLTPTLRQLKVLERHLIELVDMHEVSQNQEKLGTPSTGSGQVGTKH